MPDFITLQNVFMAIAMFATVLYILKLLIFLFVGGDTEVDANFDAMTETEVSFNYLSVQSILAFFMGFGWAGLSSLVQFELGAKLSVLIAFIVGLAFMFLSSYLMFGIKKLNKNIKIDLNELVNKEGKAYTSIKSHSEGQIEIDLNGKLSILNAINDSDEEIASFSQIRVEKVENNKIYVIKI